MGRQTNRICIAALALVLASGCVHYQPKPLLPAQAMNNLESRTLADVGLRAFIETNAPDVAKEWPRRSWDLAGLTLVAFYYHPSLDLARAQVGVAEAGVITAGGRPNPSVSFAPQYNASALSRITPWTLGFSFDLPIETAGKRGFRMTAAEHLSESARLNLATTAWSAQNGVVIPRGAVVRFNGKPWIYFQTGDQTFARREISLEQPLADGWFAAQGMKPGERVVVSGAQMLLSEEQKYQIKIGD